MSEEAKGPGEGGSPRYVLGGRFRIYKGDKITFDLSPEARKVLNDLMNRTDSNAADVFRKALALYKAALDAHEQGKAVGSAATPDVLETEFVGL